MRQGLRLPSPRLEEPGHRTPRRRISRDRPHRGLRAPGEGVPRSRDELQVVPAVNRRVQKECPAQVERHSDREGEQASRLLPSAAATTRTTAGTRPTNATICCVEARSWRAHASVPSFSHASQSATVAARTAKHAAAKAPTAASRPRRRAIWQEIGTRRDSHWQGSPRVRLRAGRPADASAE